MAGLTSPGASTWAGLRADSGLSVCEKFTRPVVFQHGQGQSVANPATEQREALLAADKLLGLP